MICSVLLLLAASFGLKRPSSGQYLQKTFKKMLVHKVQKRQVYRITFTFINSLYNYYQLSDVLSGNMYHSIYIIEFPHSSLQIAHLKAGNNYKVY